MTVRQPFHEFLDSGAGPSTPRGQGRGRGGRGYNNDARGVFLGRPRGRGGSQSTDYSNVPFDYDKIGKQSYVPLSGFNVTPFGPKNDTPSPSGYSSRGRSRGRGGWTPRGRGSGLLADQGGHAHVLDRSSLFPSGATTPVTGLGFRGDRRGGRTRRHIVGSTLVKGLDNGEVIWGGRGAPLFVKAGELFRDGEVDVISLDENKDIHIDILPLSDPSAPQMDDLRDDFEIDFPGGASESTLQEFGSVETSEENTGSSSTEQMSTVRDDQLLEDRAMAHNAEIYEDASIIETAVNSVDTIIQPVGQPVEQYVEQPMPLVSRAVDLESDLFIIDTEPSISAALPTYDSPSSVLLGVSATALPSDEEIVFAPRTFRQPEPISVPITDLPEPVASSSITHVPTNVFMDPRARTRTKKQAAKKKNKKAWGKGRARRGQEEMMLDSDLEWGSDGPPSGTLEVLGVDEEQHERDVDVLRDYLAGTLLNELAEQDEDEDVVEDDEEVDLGAVRESDECMGQNSGGLDVATRSDDDDEEEDEVSGSGWGSDSSSELSDLERVLEALESDGTDNGDGDDDDGGLFQGKQNWKTETDWFIHNMEDALDGGPVDLKDRKQRNQLFRSIKDGDFGDDWPRAPAKKKGKSIPAQLQAQLEKDRQTKKAKKEQRRLERLLAGLPQTATHKDKKAKGKGHSKAAQASLAHIIPASAAQVADMFDTSSNDEMPLPTRGRMARMMNPLLPQTFEQLEVEIRAFIADEGRTTYGLPPMPKETRKKVHLLADAFGLNSKSRGSGSHRFIALIKTGRSGRNIDKVKIERLVYASSYSGGAFYKALYLKQGKGKDKERRKGPPRDRGNSARPKEGDLVGEGAEKIGTDNIGHKLLSKMGWAEGDRIGRTGGLDAPIIAIVKNTKSGLGA